MIDENAEEQETITLNSYVRLGNTMSRAYLEKITGLLTGADGDMTSELVRVLQDMGFDGEGIIDKRMWIVKSHYPDS